MKIRLRRTRPARPHTVSLGLTLMLACVVVVPAGGLIWFMRQALDNEQAAIRQRLLDTYQAQLSGIRLRLEEGWRRNTATFQGGATWIDASRQAVRMVSADLADAVVVYDADGTQLHPFSGAVTPAALPAPEWLAAERLESTAPRDAVAAFARIATAATDPTAEASARQAQIRAMLRAGDAASAWAALEELTRNPRLANARDPSGRLIVPAAELLQLDLAPAHEPAREPEILARLRQRVLDANAEPMPSAQFRFLLRSLHGRSPGTDTAAALAAEELAAAYVELSPPPARDPILRRSGLPEVWQIGFAEGRGVALHRSDALRRRLAALAEPTGLPADVRLVFVAPDEPAPAEGFLSIPAGPTLPGWQIAAIMRDPAHLTAAARARASAYLWIASLVVASVLILAIVAWGLIRRQTALTQLRNDLVANVSHELKTPLASMRLLVETLLNTPAPDPATTREYLQLIAAENLRLSRLIGNFLTFSRIERNRYSFDFRPVAPSSLVEGAAQAVRDRMSAHGCVFELRIEPGLPELSADADAMVTALVNLLDNAWKYSGDDKRITLAARARDGQVELSVSDNGVGLAPRDAQRIFRRFEQVRHTAGPGGGVGLGLSIVQFIVAAHRGRVDLESTPGRGSTFTMSLPASTSPS